MARGRPEEALAAFEAAIAELSFLEEQPHSWAERRFLAQVRRRYGYLLASMGRPEAGERHMRWACVELDRLMELDPDNAQNRIAVAAACQFLAEHLSILGKYEEREGPPDGAVHRGAGVGLSWARAGP